MLNLIIVIYCSFANNYYTCEKNINQCIERHNQIKYEDSMWVDVPNEKMSVESFQECVK